MDHRQRLTAARDARPSTDYIFEPLTAFGWLILTCGVYIFYIYYRLVQRMREHNRRRLELLEATNALAWERAVAAGRADELRPRFERVAADLAVLRSMTGEFRDPAIWLLLIILGQTVVVLVANWLLDVDLMKHAAAEAGAEWQLTEILGLLGLLGLPFAGLPAAPAPKSPHQYVARVVVTLVTCGLYGYWWMYDVMKDGNDHFRRDWAWEDALVAAVW